MFLLNFKESILAAEPNTFKIGQIMSDNNIVEWVDYGKSVILPKRVEVGHLHSPMLNHIIKGYEHVKLTVNDTHTIHFRGLNTDKVSIYSKRI